MDIASGELVEKELDQMIERRSRKKDPDEEHELWEESAGAGRHDARRREENRRAWCNYFSRLAGSLRARAEECDQRAALLESRGEGIR